MSKCDCYHETTERKYLSEFEKGYYCAKNGVRKDFVDVVVSRCYGTKECEVCSCNGDRTKCDFYEDVRKLAKKVEKAKLDQMELEFYREYIVEQDLLYDALAKYEKWKIKKGKNNDF